MRMGNGFKLKGDRFRYNEEIAYDRVVRH